MSSVRAQSRRVKVESIPTNIDPDDSDEIPSPSPTTAERIARAAREARASAGKHDIALVALALSYDASRVLNDHLHEFPFESRNEEQEDNEFDRELREATTQFAKIESALARAIHDRGGSAALIGGRLYIPRTSLAHLEEDALVLVTLDVAEIV